MYKSWCEDGEKRKKITICYISCYGYTETIAKALAEGMQKCDVDVKLYNLQKDSVEEAKDSLATSNGIAVGSPTILSNALPPVFEALSGLNPIVNKGMKAITFGSFAWSGEAPDTIMTIYKMLRFNVPFEPIRIKLKPSEYDIEQIQKIGEEFAKKVINE